MELFFAKLRVTESLKCSLTENNHAMLSRQINLDLLTPLSSKNKAKLKHKHKKLCINTYRSCFCRPHSIRHFSSHVGSRTRVSLVTV